MKQDLTDAKKIIADEVPYLCLCYKTYAAVTSADFEGLIVSQFNDYYASCQDWSVRFLQPEEEKSRRGQRRDGAEQMGQTPASHGVCQRLEEYVIIFSEAGGNERWKTTIG